MKVSFELRRRADNKGPDEERFNQLANSVEKFTHCLLDPLRSDQEKREQFGENILDDIVDDAIDLDQKQFFTHPVVHDEMTRKWHGRAECMKKTWRGRDFKKSEIGSWLKLLLFRFWCIFDLVFSPILFSVFSLVKKRSEQCERSQVANRDDRHVTVAEMYLIYLETPYFKFVRDTLSYIVLVVLHYALCLSPSTIALSGLELAILVFFIGRYLVEGKQICDILQRIKQRREKGDVGAQSKWIRLKTLSIYLSDCWNRLDFVSLLVYLIIFTLRLVIVVMSGSEMNNRALAIAGYFYSFNTLCLTLRVFGYVMEHSRQIGPIQMALFSILADIRVIFWQFAAAILAFSIAITKVYMAEKSFIANGSDGNDIWWTIITHLVWTLLGASEETEPVTSVDVPSVTLARLLYATFHIFGVILLFNMLIALLSNTYQRTQDNSLKEWSIKRATVIQTYDGYGPIPVPLNIIYSFLKLLVRGKEKETAWADVDEGVRIEGLLLTCECMSCQDDETCHGARHGKSFSSEVPHFEVAILETGEKRWLAVGVVTEEYSTKCMPGWKNGAVGYHTDDGMIIRDNITMETKGPAMARRGDRIRCTVMFENKREEDGKVPVVFTLNGKKIIMIMKEGDDQIFMDADKPLYPCISMTDGCSVLVKMCSREDLDSKATAQSMEKRTTEIKQQNESSIARRLAKLEKGVEDVLAILKDILKKDPPKV
ncbi:hypothetical protein OS493_020758 [Desmophyllum pertusum]|uniref:Uncharacterized protein n=1 Tax=Desmophyllum pertusum TaxID=174260 RepID=A0A9X0CK97_9CNID|nr:hypothetical protein OS493_020758 [Desmophyllum pertusum]